MNKTLQSFAICPQCLRPNRVHLNTNKLAVCGVCQAQLPLHGAIVEASDKTLQVLIDKAPLPIVLDVWAPWCGPCRAFAPVFEEMSQRYAGQIIFAKLNSDQNGASAGSLGIRGIPTIVFFKDGKEVSRQSGALPREQLAAWLTQHLS